MADPEDSDDLDIVDSTRRHLGTAEYITKVVESDLEDISHLTQRKNERTKFQPQIPHTQGERMQWSDDGSDDACDKLRNRKNAKRKRVAAPKRRTKAGKEDRIVGKRPKKNGAKKDSARTKDLGADSEEDLMEHTLPDYLQQRKARFDRRMEKLRESGLRLPPSYENIDFSDDERLEELAEKPNFPLAKPLAAYKDIELPKSLGLIPASIAQRLRTYQVEGTAFLHQLFVYQTGGILGDDMGLGKTVQVIAFLTAAFGKTGDERDAKRMRKMRRAAGAPWYPRVLIICPGTLIENWKTELKRWGWWNADVFHADTKESAIQAATSGRVEIMFTTYTTYRMNKSEINMIDWDCVIADECHQIKGRRSETTQAMNEINALCRIGLTGTAIQNSYDELWTLLNWTNPGKFGPIKTWKTSISEPLKMGQSHEATNHQLSKARKTAKALVENLLPQFLLRRMKSIIADQLPKKSDRVVFCPLTPTQSEAYENCLDSDVMHYIKTSADMCICGSGKKSGWCCNMLLPDGRVWQSYVFPSMQTLQKLSNHLAMLIPQSTDPRDRQDKDLETLQTAVPDRWQDLYRNRDSILNYSNPEFCGKWKILKKLLTFWHANGDKVLVFSHSVKLLKMLQMLFKHTSYNVSYLDGSMPYTDRAKTVDDFNSDPSEFVFLISTRAGGVGLNITSANKVVVVDPNWNPAYDLQAQDRAYRIGQARDVEVFRLVSAGTIEEIVYARQVYKQQQMNIGYTASHERRYFRGVQDQKEHKGEIFGLANLFAFQGDNIVLRDIVNKTNVAESKAGVAVVGLDVDDSQSQSQSQSQHDDDDPLISALEKGEHENEDTAMSQVAALIAGDDEERAKDKYGRKNKKLPKATAPAKTDPIQAILLNAGVKYTHENSEVVGPSRVEASLSRRALENGVDLDLADQHVFQDTQEREEERKRGDGSVNMIGGDDGGGGRSKVGWRYHPPLEVRKRQLCEMARWYGMEGDVVGFALCVEGWTQEGRRRWLDGFYRARRRELQRG
ncbi:MAG: hypothetical protein Q9210_001762 [Variospora velana]